MHKVTRVQPGDHLGGHGEEEAEYKPRGPWIGYEKAAEYLDYSRGYLRQLVMQNAIPHERLGPMTVRFSVPALDEWVMNGGLNVREGAGQGA